MAPMTADVKNLKAISVGPVPKFSSADRSSSGTSTPGFTPDPKRTFHRGATTYFLLGRDEFLGQPQTAQPILGLEIEHADEVLVVADVGCEIAKRLYPGRLQPADLEAGVFAGRAGADDDLVLAPLEHPARGEVQMVAHLGGGGRLGRGHGHAHYQFGIGPGLSLSREETVMEKLGRVMKWLLMAAIFLFFLLPPSQFL